MKQDLLNRLQAWAERLAGAAIRAGGVLMLAAALLVAFDVTLRKLFNTTLGGADELAGYAFAIATSWSFAFVLLKRGNVRIDALYMHLPRRACALLDLLAVLALGSFAIVLARYAYDVMAYSWSAGARSNSSLQVPLWAPQLAWWAGLVLYVVTLCLLLLRSAALLVSGRFEEVHEMLGARTAEEEAADEATQARERDLQQAAPFAGARS
jgi:TRAP-type C4-dicarboxylate transport system permease small subunit